MNTFLTTVLFLAIALPMNAQTWQWGKRGGSAQNSRGSGDFETVKDLATDPKGNVYVLSTVREAGLSIDGHAKTGYGDDDIMVSSFSCDGSYRWSKLIGSPIDEVGIAIKTDALGGVYALGAIRSFPSYGPCHIDSDTTLGYTFKNTLLVKFDTSGAYKWSRMPEADTVSANGSQNFSLDLAVDPDGTSHTLCYLTPGSFANGAFVNTDTGAHLLKYDANGNFLGNVTPQLKGGDFTSYSNLRFIHTLPGNKYYFTCTTYNPIAPGFIINNTVYPNRFIVALNGTGNFIWGRQTTGYWNIDGRPALDASGRLFIGGSCRAGDTFNGYTGTAQNGIYGAPAVSAMDTNGNMLWNTTATSNSGAGAAAIATSGNEVVIAGAYPGKVKWFGANDSLNQEPNSGYNVFIARLNTATGAYIRQDSLASPAGFSEQSSSIAADRNGNYFVGGYFEAQVTVAGANLISTGGETDFFVAKYGVAGCNCTAPVAAYSSQAGSSPRTITFTYTGTTPLDSVRWDFGDGATSNQMSPVHTFASGSYSICVTAYNSCGSNRYCNPLSLSVASLTMPDNAKMYPNPANDHLTVEGLQAGSYAILNAIGQRLSCGRLNNKEQISVSGLPAGTYLLQLTDAAGKRSSLLFEKQ